MSVESSCSTCFCVVLCVGFCKGHFLMVPLNVTHLHCLQHSFFKHLFNLYLFTTNHIMFLCGARYVICGYTIFLFNVKAVITDTFAWHKLTYLVHWLQNTCFVVFESIIFRLHTYYSRICAKCRVVDVFCLVKSGTIKESDKVFVSRIWYYR